MKITTEAQRTRRNKIHHRGTESTEINIFFLIGRRRSSKKDLPKGIVVLSNRTLSCDNLHQTTFVGTYCLGQNLFRFSGIDDFLLPRLPEKEKTLGTLRLCGDNKWIHDWIKNKQLCDLCGE